MLAYLGPGLGFGAIVVLLGIAISALIVLYAFVYLPIRNLLRAKKSSEEEQ